MTILCDCKTLDDEFPGSALNDLPDLAKNVREESVDRLNWTRTLRCDVCGQFWEERYEELGHGEVPTVRKMKAE